MGYEVSLIGITNLILSEDGEITKPMVAVIVEEMGFSGLVSSLECCTGCSTYLNPRHPNVEILKEVENSEAGVRQWLINYPLAFVEEVRANPQLWDSVGLEFERGIRLIEEHPSYTWWIHASY